MSSEETISGLKDITQQFNKTIPSLSAITDNLEIELQDLFDIYSNYFDIIFIGYKIHI